VKILSNNVELKCKFLEKEGIFILFVYCLYSVYILLQDLCDFMKWWFHSVLFENYMAQLLDTFLRFLVIGPFTVD